MSVDDFDRAVIRARGLSPLRLRWEAREWPRRRRVPGTDADVQRALLAEVARRQLRERGLR